jgi:DNA-binding NarL/FixJ family response regulator
MTAVPTTPLPRPIRVFIVDDHPIFTNVISDIIAGLEGFLVVGAATSGRATVELLPGMKIDIMLVDLRLPDLGGLELIHIIRETHPHVRVLVCSGLETPESIAMSFRSGAYTYVQKSGRVEDLIAALQGVADGRTILREEVASALRKSVTSSRSLKALSAVDFVILRRLADNVAPKDVALETGLSLSAIYKARSRIFQRCGLTNKHDMHAAAAKLGLAAPLRIGELN